MSNVASVFASGDWAFAIKSDGTLWAVGVNSSGQLGLGNYTSQTTFTQVPGITNAEYVATSSLGHFSILLESDGTVWATGSNNSGQFGDGTTTGRDEFTQIGSLGSDNVSIAAGGDTTMVLKSDGTVWGSGSNTYGMIGDGTITNTSTFVQATTAGSDNIEISAGAYTTMVLKSDGSVWATGQNTYGQLGIGNTTHQSSFTASTLTSGVSHIQAGSTHTLALSSDGTLWATGIGSYGRLGLGDTANRSSFTEVTGVSNIDELANFSGHSSFILGQ
jgi:alpha-tubulin suppressor-like RCC1 family protein